jgi:hypothetical protein
MPEVDAGRGAFDFSSCVGQPVPRGFPHYENNPRTYFLDNDHIFCFQRACAGGDPLQSIGNFRTIAYWLELKVGAFCPVGMAICLFGFRQGRKIK